MRACMCACTRSIKCFSTQKNLRQTPKVREREMEETKHKTFNAFPHEGGENMLFYMCCISEVRVRKEEQSIRVLKKVMFYAV